MRVLVLVRRVTKEASHPLIEHLQVFISVRMDREEDTSLPLAGHKVGELLRTEPLLILQLGRLVGFEPHAGREDEAGLDEGALLRFHGGASALQPGDVAPVLLPLLPDGKDVGPVVRIVEAAVLVEDEADPTGIGSVGVAQRCRCMQFVLGYLKSREEFKI